MERRLERLVVSEAASDGALWLRVPLFHRSIIIPLYLSQACDTIFPACAWNNGTEGLFFEWERVFHEVFHYDGTVEQTVEVVLRGWVSYNSISPPRWCQ